MNTLLATSYLYFFFNNPNSQVCLSQDRRADCTIEEVFKPVCMLYSGGDCESPVGFCQRTINNGCEACLDSNVAGYILGECEETPVQACSFNHLNTECENFNVEGTVCGIQLDSPEEPDINRLVFNNGCEACGLDSGFYLAGEAHGECMAVSTSTICKYEDRMVTDCPTDDGLKACAYYRGNESNGCTDQICRKTVDSYCHACIDSDVLFYLNGRCEDNVPIPEEGISLAAPQVEEVRSDDEPEAIIFLL